MKNRPMVKLGGKYMPLDAALETLMLRILTEEEAYSDSPLSLIRIIKLFENRYSVLAEKIPQASRFNFITEALTSLVLIGVIYVAYRDELLDGLEGQPSFNKSKEAQYYLVREPNKDKEFDELF